MFNKLKCFFCFFRSTYESMSCSRNVTPVVASVYSDMCVRGGCGKYGRCYQFFSGGNMFSTCSCFAGEKKKTILKFLD